jgi:uncharacterized protein
VTAPQRPVPVVDDRSAPFWEAADRGVLAIARCARCDSYSHPPDIVCAHCHSTEPEFVFTEVSGRGSVRSWTVMRQSFLPGFEVPFVLVDVELDEQPELRLIGRLLDGEDAHLQLGARVHVAFESLAPSVAESVAESVSVPAFVLEESR